MDVNGILDLIEDKSGVIKFLIETMMKSSDITENLRKYAGNEEISDKAKIKALLEITANQNVQIVNWHHCCWYTHPVILLHLMWLKWQLNLVKERRLCKECLNKNLEDKDNDIYQ